VTRRNQKRIRTRTANEAVPKSVEENHAQSPRTVENVQNHARRSEIVMTIVVVIRIKIVIVKDVVVDRMKEGEL
jgi:hypothetical protein